MSKGNTAEPGPVKRDNDHRLLAELIDAYIAGGKSRPRIPAGRRDEVIALLTGLMADRDRYDAYLTDLHSELMRQDLRLQLLQGGIAGPDTPDDQIAREGFANLSDDQLADIAISPEVIETLQEYLDDPETEEGHWLTKAVSEVMRAHPDAAEQSDIANRVYKRLSDAGLLEPAQTPILPIDKVKQQRRPHSYRWFGPSIGLAASLLLAFLLGTQMRVGDADLDAARARVTPGGALGGQTWTLQVPSSQRAFVTLALLGSNNLPEYHPESGKLLETGPDKPLGYTVEGQVGDSLFVVLTETPATDVLNNATALAVNGRRQSWNDADSFGRFLDETLRSLGYKHFSVRKIPLSR